MVSQVIGGREVLEILEFLGKIFDAIGQSARKKSVDSPARRDLVQPARESEIKNPVVRVTHKLANLITFQSLRNRDK